ncbi:MAG: hydrogenase formation protein HypD [Methanomassiliicoccaceae archaeon]|jgi:hydrogenase expression/formation protein HypD|nr:hydrogenase formation protein HypD [Methanomassiliicoccaceae archaeon]HOL07551.1 hydrogenase formation protein HypD [Methanomassiliicoccaceae archaeon]HQA21984.1 hydrogenase formation protein HypD [Methanomassiliicoccaceae archaeon]HQD88728.1 hydrogenase formation protein HypD [Methanomassiliicoccaceae archaeon]
MFRYRDEKAAQRIIESIRKEDVDLRFMHVCGTHQDTLVRFGLESMLRDVGVEIRQGPGCPVCVTTSAEIADAIALADAGITISVFGDMLKVPTPIGSLGDAKARGADVRVVYSVEDAVRLAKEVKNMVFMAIGFETTSPTTAAVMVEDLPENFSVLSCHRLLPPALDAIIKMGDFRIDGLIEPGHVSVMIGEEPYQVFSKRDKVPQVIAGFEPLDLLMAAYLLVRQVKEGRAEVENEYTRLVKKGGNPRAIRLLDEVFMPVDRAWRGFPMIPKGTYELRPKYDDHNARKVHEDILAKRPPVKEEIGACRCGEMLRGIIDPQQCPVFGKACNPAYPMGPCMVSREGGCNIAYRYRGRI